MKKFSILFSLLFVALLNNHLAQEVGSLETVNLEEKDVPEQFKLSNVALSSTDEQIDKMSDKSWAGSLCKKYKCGKKVKCHTHECNCSTHKFECNCGNKPYKCCEKEQYPCKCIDEKYPCNCTLKKHPCNCYEKTYDCRCEDQKYKCNCKKEKYACGYTKTPRHDDTYGHDDHTEGDDDKDDLYHTSGRTGYGSYGKRIKYCYRNVCSTCKKRVCDKCTKKECDTCTKKECDTCTRRKCLDTCTKDVCKTCYKKQCEQCKEKKCETCKKCETVNVGCKYFYVKCGGGHKDDSTGGY